MGALTSLFSILLGSAAPAPLPSVVSLDFCADQYVLALADRDQILALSVQADDQHSALRDQAEGLPQIRASAEDVLALNPDLVVRSYGGDARTLAFYDRIGLPVHTLGFAAGFDDIEANIRATAEALVQPAQGEALIAEMRAKLAQANRGERHRVLYITPTGTTSGGNTLIHTMLDAARLDNIAADSGAVGWRTLPLEELATTQPDYVVASFFDSGSAARDSWSVSTHPVFSRMMDKATRLELEGALTACSNWMLADAALSLRTQIEAAE